MRKNVTLYIGNLIADLSGDGLILFNYTQEDLTNPTIVKNSYSQQVTLKGSDANNQIFTSYFRNDRTTAIGSFNALAKTSFTIYNETSEIIESGYCKLESVERKGSEITYKITLYGGLGGFLYSLMYDDDGNKLSLADMTYTSGGDDDEFDFNINKQSVRQAWRHIAGIDTTNPIWSHINFAPCYNGLPSGKFAANKALCPTSCYGVSSSVVDGGVTYKDRSGHTLVTLADKYDEWATKDLRSYLQRPVIRVKSIIDACTDSAQNGGYSVTLDSSFFKTANPYYQRLYLTLPRFDSLKIPAENGTEDITWGFVPILETDKTYAKNLVNGDKGIFTNYKITATFRPSAINNGEVTPTFDPYYMAKEYWDGTQAHALRTVVFYQLLAYDVDNVLVGGSKVIAISSAMTHSGSSTFPDSITTAQALAFANGSVGYTPLWNPTGVAADIAGAMTLGTYSFIDDEGLFSENVTLECSANDVHHVVLRTMAFTIIDDNQTMTNTGPRNTDRLFHSGGDMYAGTLSLTGYSAIQTSLTNTADYSTSGQISSDAAITKSILLGGTASPAEYLLSYCKMFGLNIVYNSSTRAVSIVTRNTLYTPNDGAAKIHDIDERIDRQTMGIVPFVLTKRWYDFGLKYDSAAWADYYESTKGIRYGLQRVNTGYQFNAEHNEVLDGNIFKGACEVLEQNKYYVKITQDSKVCPSPFLDGGKFSLWDNAGNSKEFDITLPNAEMATVTYINPVYKGYDYLFYPKVQFHDAEGKGSDGSNVLLMFENSSFTAAYDRYCLSDDSGLMPLYNGGQPCWLLGQAAANPDYNIDSALPYPIFRRYNYNMVTKSLDFGQPLEVNEPAVTFPTPDTSNIYAQAWKAYITDRYDADTRIVTCKANLRGIGEQIGQNLLRNIYWFDNSYWVLNKISNFSITTDDLIDCEFIKIKDITAYTNGQTY